MFNPFVRDLKQHDLFLSKTDSTFYLHLNTHNQLLNAAGDEFHMQNSFL